MSFEDHEISGVELKSVMSKFHYYFLISNVVYIKKSANLKQSDYIGGITKSA
jgi:hypothetical protein